MWVFTKYGFYSAVCARQGEGEPGQPIDPDRTMIRARAREHLEALQARFPEELGAYGVREFARSDYPCRLFVPKDVWARVLAALASEIDYGNFKSQVDDSLGADYARALHRTWSVMRDFQG